ncbi:hypothetical protein X801_02966 [Opisthorchis viverrini]|uniref:Uncharacterized protein n=1 Tax=Opisthorchis viverrini TaxID=6198 RepID=A0A1S8X3C8_OPIVI|nr:hypothetical protein X801_02966 [Opisthorchis viverrini]
MPTASTIGYRHTDLVLCLSEVKSNFMYDFFLIAVRLSCVLIDVRIKQVEDDVDKVLTAERQSLKRLKHTLEKYLARVGCSYTVTHVLCFQDLITVKTMLKSLLDEYTERLRKLSRCKRQSILLTTNSRYASSSEGFSADSMNPRKLLTLVESFFQQALGLRKELDSLFARVPPFVRSTQNSVHQALLNNSAQLIARERELVLLEMQQNQTRNRCLRTTHALVNQSGQPACKALKPVDKELARLDEAKGQLNKEMHTIRRSIDADLHIARTRRRAETHRLSVRTYDNEGFQRTNGLQKAQSNILDYFSLQKRKRTTPE